MTSEETSAVIEASSEDVGVGPNCGGDACSVTAPDEISNGTESGAKAQVEEANGDSSGGSNVEDTSSHDLPEATEVQPTIGEEQLDAIEHSEYYKKLVDDGFQKVLVCKADSNGIFTDVTTIPLFISPYTLRWMIFFRLRHMR